MTRRVISMACELFLRVPGSRASFGITPMAEWSRSKHVTSGSRKSAAGLFNVLIDIAVLVSLAVGLFAHINFYSIERSS